MFQSVLDDKSLLDVEPKFQNSGFYLAIGSSYANHITTHIRDQAIKHNWNIQITDKTYDMGILSLQGPKSRQILESVCSTSFENKDFPYMSHQLLNIGGHQIRTLRVSFIGELGKTWNIISFYNLKKFASLGYELHMKNEAMVDVYHLLHEVGRNHQLKNVGFRALDILSAEKGYVHWHQDLTMEDTPLEAGLGFTCKLKTDIDFLGRKNVETQKQEGLSKKMITFTVDDPSVPLIWGQEPIYRDDICVGFIRRAEYSNELGRSIGYAYVQDSNKNQLSKEFLTTGKWTIETLLQKKNITLHYQPPFDPKGLKLCK